MESFTRAYFNIGSIGRRRSSRYRAALHLCRDRLRSRAYRCSLQTDSFDASAEESGGTVGSTEDTPDQRTGRNEELFALANAINELPTDLKNAFVLRTSGEPPRGKRCGIAWPLA
jgi:DNA-directed RNA polymerase specialized sigma24 family protein